MRHNETYKAEVIRLLYYFEIRRKLPSLNVTIGKNRTNKYLGAKFKAEIEEAIGWDIKQALTQRTLKPITEPCDILIDFHESTMRRDVDNIQSAQKFILDSMVKNGILKNDNRRWVKQIYHTIHDDSEDWIAVTIRSAGQMKILT